MREPDGLLPCPFCGEPLTLMVSDFGERIYEHPDNDCIAEDIYVADDPVDTDRWNKRAASKDLLAALQGLLERYTALVNSGDCGTWNPEEEAEVTAARAAISKALQQEGK